jgi:hypothetical protein
MLATQILDRKSFAISSIELEARAIAQALRSASQGSGEYGTLCHRLRADLTELKWLGVLDQFVNHGPVEDGDVISKSIRDSLLGMGLLSRACVQGQQGYTVATYTGWDVYKASAL